MSTRRGAPRSAGRKNAVAVSVPDAVERLGPRHLVFFRALQGTMPPPTRGDAGDDAARWTATISCDAAAPLSAASYEQAVVDTAVRNGTFSRASHRHEVPLSLGTTPSQRRQMEMSHAQAVLDRSRALRPAGGNPGPGHYET
jgi:hypothetical protein